MLDDQENCRCIDSSAHAAALLSERWLVDNAIIAASCEDDWSPQARRLPGVFPTRPATGAKSTLVTPERSWRHDGNTLVLTVKLRWKEPLAKASRPVLMNRD